jgi:hypothetical protein
MLIESKIKREGGTHVTLDGVSYHFKQLSKEDDRHVCEVANDDHIERFLAVSEGFRPARVFTADHKKIEMPKRAEVLQPEPVEAVEPEPVEEEAPAVASTRDELVEQFQARFGRKPHGKWNDARIRQELESA